jgi:signal transduction histidine kinase
MELHASKTPLSAQRIAVLGTADDAQGQQIAREVSRIARLESLVPVITTTNIVHIEELSARFQPAVILLDECLAPDVPLDEPVRKLACLAPVVLIASVDRQAEVAAIVASGEIDFVARTGNFAPLAIGLAQRQLRGIRPASQAVPFSGFQGDLAEIVRHEINNPLTGILGNAEMLLSHRDRLHLADIQRLQTVVDLAVRLRETTRRISAAWEHQTQSLKSA